MLKIAHISDLHIRHPELDVEKESLLQAAAKYVGKSALGFEVHASSHSDDKLRALEQAICVEIKPDVIVVTGDLTNFGDEKSLQLARMFLDRLRAALPKVRIICVPGNHDCLVERAGLLKERSFWHKATLKIFSALNREVATMLTNGVPRLPADVELTGPNARPLLKNYTRYITPAEFGNVDPAYPIIVDAGWGKVSFFLFNSVNDPGFMANQGRIGPEQFAQCNSYLSQTDGHKSHVKIALLHHHPVSAPDAMDSAVERAYDWMHDGPLFMQYLNHHRFHFILHGHQHEPFTCRFDYTFGDERHIQILAAGTATQGNHQIRSSFNVLELLTPFEALFQRYDYRQTGFRASETKPQIIPVRPLSDVRVYHYNDQPTTKVSEDTAMRELVRGCVDKQYGVDVDHIYDEFDYQVEITADQQYIGQYRRTGIVAAGHQSPGLVFVIVGSPANHFADLNIKASDNQTGQSLQVQRLVDLPHQKVVRVAPGTILKSAEKFDITLRFQWQASDVEPNHFDAINLMPFSLGVKKLTYRVVVPWHPPLAQIIGLGITDASPECTESLQKVADSNTDFQYCVEVTSPAPIVYCFSFAPPNP